VKRNPFRPVLAGIAFLRRRLTRIRIRREAARSFTSIAPLRIGETKTLEILPLYESASRDDLQAGPGVSYLIRTDQAAILFDLGDNPASESPSPLERNMARLGVSLGQVDLVVISHRHPDHVGGLKWWAQKSFSMTGTSQPALGNLPIYVSDKLTYPGSRPRLAGVPMKLAEGVATTGPFTFFESYPAWQIRPNYSEQALAVRVAGFGLVLITGCGHMGLKALLERTRAVFGAPAAGVIGGLHYTASNADNVQPGIRLLQEVAPRIVALSPHDSSPEALAAFAKAFPAGCRPIRVGETIKIS
jgi:7,8-dihydropterin-6-yl-methyl-4-(beta-D-ribofuranosyl)aminobenzene 5'-phosphate synthase